jgi:hypothetical protein
MRPERAIMLARQRKQEKEEGGDDQVGACRVAGRVAGWQAGRQGGRVAEWQGTSTLLLLPLLLSAASLWG